MDLKLGVRLWTGLRTGGIFQHGDEPSGTQKLGNFFTT